MGQRLAFYYVGKNGIVDFILAKPLNLFRDWYQSQSQHSEFGFEITAQELALLDDVIARGAAAFTARDATHHDQIERFAEHFLWWCGLEVEGEEWFEEANASYINVRNYLIEPEVTEILGSEAGRLWAYLLHGRDVTVPGNNPPYKPRDDRRGLSDGVHYWTYDEVIFMHQRIAPYANCFSIFPDKTFSGINATSQAIENAFHRGVGLLFVIDEP